jgi:polysaccharide biosynthesis/export protein
MTKFSVVAILIILVTTSCSKPLKDLSYFKTGTDSARKSPAYHEAIISKGDIISIVISSDDPRASELFNLTNNQPSNVQMNTTTLTSGYLVNEQGNIQIYQLGDVKVEGMTKYELTNTLKEKLSPYLQHPIVNVRLLNFKITVLGEVNRPGTYSIPNEKVNLIEALGLAGDLTIYGQRKTVMIIRQENDQNKFIEMDLTNKDVFNSPYFNLKQNDVVYVDVNPRKIKNTDQTTARNIGIIAAIISSVAFLITVVRS